MQKVKGGDLLDSDTDFIKLHIPPWPEFSAASYRHFIKNEKHITRMCDHYVLIFMLENELFFTEDGIKIEIKKGEWYVQRPGLLQQGIMGSPAPSYFYIHFYATGEAFDDQDSLIYTFIEDKTSIILEKKGLFNHRLLKPLFDQLDYCYKNKSHDILSIQSIFLTILNNITKTFHKAHGNGLAEQIASYISENYNKDLNCDLLADRFHFSTEYINRKVKQYYGLTPGQYLQQIRIARAKELLSNTDHTLSFITSEVGYHDTTVLYKAFKKQTGISPGKWRESSRGLK
ncbi:MAG: hypothetical protein K0S01_2272 [Herbinix sp.]|jgi:AraC-like DNA-binding protein|nr:hypothetical protein [Herbinix sp.]